MKFGGSSRGRIVRFGTGSMVINGSTINGNTATLGGGIYIEGDIDITTSTIDENTAESGGGLYIRSGNYSATVSESSISGNASSFFPNTNWGGGGIYNTHDQVIIWNTVISNNQVVGSTGGGVWNDGDLQFHRVTIDGNTSNLDGVAIVNYGGILTLSQSTVSNHSAGNDTVMTVTGGEVRIANTTFSGNKSTVAPIIKVIAPGKLSATHLTFYKNNAELVSEIVTALTSGDDITFGNSIIEASCSGSSYKTNGGNIISPLFGCGLDRNLGDLDLVSDLKLGPLVDNGGPTKTHLPLEGSPAIDFGFNENCMFMFHDQRELPRNVDILGGGLFCDAGSVEVQPVVLEELIFESSFEAGEGQ